jgi:hypothetical protein
MPSEVYNNLSQGDKFLWLNKGTWNLTMSFSKIICLAAIIVLLAAQVYGAYLIIPSRQYLALFFCQY